MAGHAVRWQGTGSDEVSTRSQKSKNPDNLIHSWRDGKINGAYLNCIEAVALCREYSFMLRKVQYLFLCHLLLPCNISAGRCD
ncbi:RepA leader peptide Tap (plasmid) [Enterobacter sp. JBIWA003]|nr:RepA leader peptide Tap [Enterobacter sp. JBIWA003]UAN34149.1 RepA leader peptide Tap [Enterobacter sp. JBIWA005]